MRRTLVLAAALAAAGCKKSAAPSSAAAPSGSGPTATIFNGVGAEARDIVVSCPEISFSSSTASLPAGHSVKLALPGGCAKAFVSFTHGADQKSEKTVELRKDATLILAADGTIGASTQP